MSLDNLSDREIINLGLEMILEFLEFSGYDRTIRWQMELRIRRMLAGATSDNNPEGRVLDYNIYKLGLTLMMNSDNLNVNKERAASVFQRRLEDGK
jgi:hypothetical protein